MADEPTIVIKKVKGGGHHGHHGGAWKVAYADFVTAMMAFFLLLWLLSATPAENLEGLADYFSPTQGIKDKAGIGFRGGKGVAPDGVSAEDWASRGIIFGAPPAGVQSRIDDGTIASGDGGSKANAEYFSILEADIEKSLTQNPEYMDLQDFLNIEITTEGLRIEIMDKKGESMFEAGRAILRPNLERTLILIAERIRYLPNYIAIEGHTNSIHYASKRGGIMYSNWELSTDRANATRRFLVESGMDPEQVVRIVGKADTSPINIENPSAPENRRITITLLKKTVLPDYKKPVPDELLESDNDIELEEFLELEGGFDDKGRIR
ncbi:MAG: OmpA family protein [Rickettsiales bacterium]|nr:OmpA family protein [Rickettsiales bacterium]